MTVDNIAKPSVTNPYGAAFLEYAGPRGDVVALAADTAGSDLSAFRAAHPDRFINIGMAEQNLIGVAGGMARGGLTPFVHTIATFLTRRPFDQIVMAVAYPRLRVRLIGGLCGLNFAGVSHQSIDDVALMRAVAGMAVIDLAEATEIETVLPTLTDIDGPVYCRIARTLLKAEVPRLFDTPFEFGVARLLHQGSDLAIISSSITTVQALRAAEFLRRSGVSVCHLHIATVHPLDRAAVLAAVEGTRGAIVVENHLTTGGLGSAVAEVLAEHGSDRRLVRLGLRNTYAGGGSESYLVARHSMDALAILKAAQALLDLDPDLVVAGEQFVGNSATSARSDAVRQSYAII